jgi:ribosomal protein L37AE/L43A
MKPSRREAKKPKTAVKGKRLKCAVCHKRSPRRVTTPAPWYCLKCRNHVHEKSAVHTGTEMTRTTLGS